MKKIILIILILSINAYASECYVIGDDFVIKKDYSDNKRSDKGNLKDCENWRVVEGVVNFIRKDDQWSNDGASGYRDAHRIKDAKALRMNTYRVLLTRGRDGCVVFIPPIADKMRETYSYLNNCGFLKL